MSAAADGWTEANLYFLTQWVRKCEQIWPIRLMILNVCNNLEKTVTRGCTYTPAVLQFNWCKDCTADMLQFNQGGDVMFEELIAIAKDRLAELNETIDGMPAPEVTVLLTDRNKIYVAANDFDGAICEELKRVGDTKIVRMVSMWKAKYCVDLPSMAFRKALIALDADNTNTEIILLGMDGYHVRKLATTMP